MLHYSFTTKSITAHSDMQTVYWSTTDTFKDYSIQTIIHNFLIFLNQLSNSSQIIFLIFAVPPVPQNLQVCNVSDEELQLCVSWDKPDGGNEIKSYIVEWTKQNAFDTESVEKDSYVYSYTIENLQPGQKVTVAARARNMAATGRSANISFATSKSSTFKRIFTVHTAIFALIHCYQSISSLWYLY